MKNTRVQPYLSPLHIDILDRFIQEKFQDEANEVKYEAAIKYLLVDYDRLKQKEEKDEKRIEYMDKNITMILNLVSSLMIDMDASQHPLEESLAYFKSQKYVESLMNNRRKLQPTNAIKYQLNNPHQVKAVNQSKEETYQSSIESSLSDSHVFNETHSSPSYQDNETTSEGLDIMSALFKD